MREKRKKRTGVSILGVFLTVLLCFTITACGNPAADDPIVGTWSMISINSGDQELSVEDYLASTDLKQAPEMVFEGNYKVTFNTGELTGSAKWSKENGKYTIIDDTNKEQIVIMELTLQDNQLSIIQSGFLLTFEKQPAKE